MLNNLRFQLRTSLLAGLFVLVGACGSTDTTVQYADDPDTLNNTDDDSITTVQDTGEQPGGDTKPQPDQTNPTGTRYRLIPLHNPAEPELVGTETVFSLQVQVFDMFENDIVAEYPVAATINKMEPHCIGDDCGFLLANESVTNAQGVATLSFNTNLAEELTYTFKFTAPEADPVFVDVQIVPIPVGDLEVVFSPNNAEDLPITPSTLKVHLGHGYVSCSNFNPVTPWSEEDEGIDLDGGKTVQGLASLVQFDGEQLNLRTTETYYVFVTGTTTVEGSEQLVVYGCTDMIHLVPQEEGATKVTVNLNVVTLVPSGTYDMVNRLDFSDAIPGQAGEIIDLIEMIFYDPGSAILVGIQELVSLYVSPALVDIVFGLFEDWLGEYITDFIFDQAPPEILQFFEAGQELLQIVDNLELYGELKLSKLSNKFNIQGIETWYGISLYWTWSCPEEDEPDYDPDCGKYSFGTDDLGDTEFPLDLLAGQFHASIHSFNHLNIDNHEIHLNYGKLILFVLNNLLLQNLTQYDNLSEMLDSILDCQHLANQISGGILGQLGISQQELEDICVGFENSFLAPIEGAIGGLTFPSTITLTGDCRMLDDDGDLVVDRLIDGIWTGSISITNENGVPENLPITGTFHADRKEYPAQ